MHRFLVEGFSPSDSVPASFVLSPEDARHARSVLRMSPGDQAEIIAGGRRFLCVLSTVTAESVTFSPLSPLPDTEPALKITLFQGLPKAEKMELIVQKSIELGIVRVVPLLMSRSVVRLSPQDASRKADRWRKIAREACKQSGRCILPEITDPLPLRQAAPLLRECAFSVVPWEECPSGGPLSFFRAHPSCPSLGIVIGPEGGMTKEEISFLSSEGCLPITLGPRILRTETAGLAAAASFLALYGEMETASAPLANP